MTNINTANWSQLGSQQQQRLLRRPSSSRDQALYNTVEGIINQVIDQGDKALIELADKFDKVKLTKLMLDKSDLERLAADLPNKVKAAIDSASLQIESFHEAQKADDIVVETRAGIVCELRQRPIEKIGLYIPGGTAPLPSTVLMLGIPSKIAQNTQRILCTPPDQQGQINPAIAYAALSCGIDEVYLSGGAQAIAAMAYGTETITKVDKIFGPGNSFVTMAKQQVSNSSTCVAIDMPAGPSEVLVIGDANANPAFVAADLLSQAEHGPDSQVILVTESQNLIAQVKVVLDEQLAKLPRQDIATESLKHAVFIQSDSLTQSIEITNDYAPEHLIIQTEDASAVVEKITNASSIFVGQWSPESAGDYASGTNHVLPTYGYSKVLSSLGLADFCKRFTVQTLSAQGLSGIGQAIIDLAEAEGLQAHSNAVSIRLATLPSTTPREQ
jgi:histidinol dehydrogenase